MAAPLLKTQTPGVYKRGSRYVIRYRMNGTPQWEACRTYDEARRLKKARDTDSDRGELHEDSRITLHEYLIGNPAKDEPGWIDRYQGTGRRGYRQETRDEDRRLLHNYVLRYFAADVQLAKVSPKTISSFIVWLCVSGEAGWSRIGGQHGPQRAQAATGGAGDRQARGIHPSHPGDRCGAAAPRARRGRRVTPAPVSSCHDGARRLADPPEASPDV